MEHLELYQAESCPFCEKVRQFCTDNGIDVLLRNPRRAGGEVTNQEQYDELLEHGMDQIPLLVDNKRGEALYESDDIVEHLDEHYC